MVLRFFLLASVFFFASCVSIERDHPDDPNGNNYQGGSSSSAKEPSPSSSSVSVKNYCVYAELKQCYFGIYSACPGVGGVLADECPYSSSSSATFYSSGQSQSGKSSSSAAEKFAYCVFMSEKMCLEGPLTTCPPGGTLSNSCPYVSSSSSAVVAPPSSSSTRQSSSSSPPSSSSSSSSSLLPSSSSVAQSSSSMPSSSSSAPPSSSSVTESSSSVAVSSSSVVVSSSSSVVAGVGLCAGFVNGTKREHYGMEKEQFCDPRDGKKYVYVTIGTQTWMAENLNYNASGSKCGNSGYPPLSDANTSICDTYGRLYTWGMAMNACPTGWRLSSIYDLNVLMKFVDTSCPDIRDCAGVGTKLKAKDGWESYSGILNTDDYGFSALPGGIGDFYNASYNVGYGYWWSSFEGGHIDYAWSWHIFAHDDYVRYDNYDSKRYYYSVRCIKN